MRTLLAAIVLLLSRLFLGAQTPADHPTVFLIVMENHPWSTNANSEHPAIKGNKNAPYINGTLLPLGAHAEQQFAHIKDFTNSLPNYIWLECGQNLFNNNNTPNKSHVPKGTPHLTSLLDQAGIPWKTYQEGIDGKSCPVRDIDKGKYAVRHNPFMYFLDVTSNEAYCNEHVRPYSQLAADLRDNKVKGYNFIKPNLIHDMHDGTVKQGDDWLSKELPVILASQAYGDGAIIFVTWDESELGDYPIGMIVLSKRVKSAGYSNTIKYTHSSTLKTLQGLFGITPTLGDTASDKVADHSDLFQPGTIQMTSVSDKAPTTPIPFAKKVTGKDNQEGDETFTVTMPVKHAGAQDGSAGIAIGQDHFIGASDENNVLRLYTSDDAEAGKELLDLNPLLGFGKEGGEFKE
jgi:hypothetical protein